MHSKEQVDSCYKKALCDGAGKVIIEDLERVCQFVPDPQNPNDVFMKLGKIELLKYIKNKIERVKNGK